MSKIKVEYQFPIYEDHTIPKGGFLSIDRRASACFHYYLLCQKLLERAGKTIEDQRFRTYEGQVWVDKPYANIAIGTATRYGLDNPGDFLNFYWKEQVERECQRMGFPPPAEEYWNVEPGKVVYT